MKTYTVDIESGGTVYEVDVEAASPDAAVRVASREFNLKRSPRRTMEDTLESVSDMPRSFIRGAVEAVPEISGLLDRGAEYAEGAAPQTGDPYSGAAPEGSPITPRIRGAIDENMPGLAQEPIGPAGRIASEAGRGATWATATAPFAAALPGGLFSVPALAAEGMALAGPPLAQASRELGAPEGVAIGTEVATGIGGPMAMAPVLARTGARTAARQAVSEATGSRVSGRRARKAARMLRSDVGEENVDEAVAALGAARENFGPDTPLTGPVLAGADVPGRTVMDRTKLLTGQAGFEGPASAKSARARRRARREALSLEPQGRPEDYPRAWMELGDARRKAASQAFKELPDEMRQIYTNKISDAINRVLDGQPTEIKRMRAERYLNDVVEDFNVIVEKANESSGFVRAEEIDDWLSDLKRRMINNPDANEVFYVGQLHDSINRVYSQSIERTGAGGMWREMKRTFEPRPPRSSTQEGAYQKVVDVATANVASNAKGIAKRLVSPGGGARGIDVARRLKTVLATEPQMRDMVHRDFWDMIYKNTSGKVRSGQSFQDVLDNPQWRETYMEAFDDPDGSRWRRYFQLALMRRQSEWSDIGKAAMADRTGSGQLASLGSEVVSAGTGDVSAMMRLGSKLLMSRYGKGATAKLFQQAYLEPELAEALLALGKLDPDAWLARVSEVAARTGLQVDGDI